MGDYRQINQNKEAYLGQYINKFRTEFNDRNLKVSTLHEILKRFGIKQTENGAYSRSILNALLSGYQVGYDGVTLEQLKNYYKNNIQTHMGTSTNITDKQNQPTSNPLTIAQQVQIPQCVVDNAKDKSEIDNGDGLIWKDGNSMEAADEILQQRYFYENRVKTIRITENQYKRIFKKATI